MNSEELEISLRTEFENYLKDVFADMRQELSQLQTKIETELENYKSQLDVSFKDALSRADSGADFDAGFKESVLEHLRLARDEGAKITATAFAEAEEMNRQTALESVETVQPSGPGIKELHAAINDISSKDSQGEILKTLVHHASQFASRGAFFIVKKEHFVAWRTFDSANEGSEETVHEVFLPVSADSILSESVRSLSTVESNSETYADDAPVLEKLGFDSTDNMFAIPLVARGRGVAVLYVDRGTQENGEVNLEALESMVHVAGLTVEILAAARGGASKKKNASDYSEESQVESSVAEPAQAETGFAPAYQVPSVESFRTDNDNHEHEQSFEHQNYTDETSSSSNVSEQSSEESKSYSYSNESYSYEQPQTGESEEIKQEFVSENDSESESVEEKPVETSSYEYAENPQPETGENYPTYEDGGWKQPEETSTDGEKSDSEEVSDETTSWNNPTENETPMISAPEYADNSVQEADSATQNYSFEPTVETETPTYNDFSSEPTNEYQFEKPIDQPQVTEFESFNAPTNDYAPAQPETNSFEMQTASPMDNPTVPLNPISTPPVKSRLSERNVDLPIEVSEDERRLHNDARRFARLLVSEIKLYNEQKVKEGREASDLYEKLREAIDRSREMYDKRVQPPVAAKFDYFHYELVNTLAEGDDGKLGAGYPGATV